MVSDTRRLVGTLPVAADNIPKDDTKAGELEACPDRILYWMTKWDSENIARETSRISDLIWLSD
jgi:hypothetical protein